MPRASEDIGLIHDIKKKLPRHVSANDIAVVVPCSHLKSVEFHIKQMNQIAMSWKTEVADRWMWKGSVGEILFSILKIDTFESCASVSKRRSVRAKPFMCFAYRFGILMQIKLMYELKLETEAQGNSQMAYCTCIVPEQLVSTYHISPRVLI